MPRFDGKTIVITGASAGIGAASARRFAAEGGRLVLAARGQERLEAIARELDAIAVPTDVADPAATQRLVDRALQATGRIDVLVNNAGAHHRGPFSDLTPEQVGQMVDVNLRAPLVLTSQALPHLRITQGVVVHVASLAGFVPLPDAATYSGTKAGLRAASRALALEEEGRSGVRHALVSPGPVATQFILDDLDHVSDMTLSQKMVSGDHVAQMVVDAAADGRMERAAPRSGAVLAHLGYLFPWMRQLLQPWLEAKGRRVRARLKAEAQG